MNNPLSEDEPRVEAVTSHSIVDHEFSIEVRFLVALLVPSLSNMFFQTHLARASFAWLYSTSFPVNIFFRFAGDAVCVWCGWSSSISGAASERERDEFIRFFKVDRWQEKLLPFPLVTASSNTPQGRMSRMGLMNVSAQALQVAGVDSAADGLHLKSWLFWYFCWTPLRWAGLGQHFVPSWKI